MIYYRPAHSANHLADLLRPAGVRRCRGEVAEASQGCGATTANQTQSGRSEAARRKAESVAEPCVSRRPAPRDNKPSRRRGTSPGGRPRTRRDAQAQDPVRVGMRDATAAGIKQQ
jgi:hypothetical protein